MHIDPLKLHQPCDCRSANRLKQCFEGNVFFKCAPNHLAAAIKELKTVELSFDLHIRKLQGILPPEYYTEAGGVDIVVISG